MTNSETYFNVNLYGGTECIVVRHGGSCWSVVDCGGTWQIVVERGEVR